MQERLLMSCLESDVFDVFGAYAYMYTMYSYICVHM